MEEPMFLNDVLAGNFDRNEKAEPKSNKSENREKMQNLFNKLNRLGNDDPDTYCNIIQDIQNGNIDSLDTLDNILNGTIADNNVMLQSNQEKIKKLEEMCKENPTEFWYKAITKHPDILNLAADK